MIVSISPQNKKHIETAPTKRFPEDKRFQFASRVRTKKSVVDNYHYRFVVRLKDEAAIKGAQIYG